MSYTYYTHYTWYDNSYEKNVDWLTEQYDKYSDRIVFANISPNDDGFIASIIVKDLPEQEYEPEQVKIQL